ncbi:MAG: ribose 5-phosphate isomerase B [Rhodothermales bacterium]|nr:ribose 5-phosphate isomerase B [Rhodothermales bacterium]
MGSRKVITEADVLAAERRGEKRLAVSDSALITPLARDAAAHRGIVFERQSEVPTPGRLVETPKAVAIGSDHGGFDYKKALSKHVSELGWEVIDVGTHSNARCDYPDFAFAVARTVTQGKASFGIMIDGAGPGSAIVANKVPSIRAACAYAEFAAWNARAHNDCNVLTLGSRATGIEVCKRIISTFLETQFEGGRHQGRIDKIRDVESHFSAEREFE